MLYEVLNKRDLIMSEGFFALVFPPIRELGDDEPCRLFSRSTITTVGKIYLVYMITFRGKGAILWI